MARKMMWTTFGGLVVGGVIVTALTLHSPVKAAESNPVEGVGRLPVGVHVEVHFRPNNDHAAQTFDSMSGRIVSMSADWIQMHSDFDSETWIATRDVTYIESDRPNAH